MARLFGDGIATIVGEEGLRKAERQTLAEIYGELRGCSTVGGIFYSSSALVVLGLQRGPISGHFLHLVVNDGQQLLAVAEAALACRR